MIEICLLCVVYVLGYFFLKNSALETIDKSSSSFALLPRHYIITPRWMRKHFCIKKHKIPRFICVRLYLALGLLILIPIIILVYLFAKCNRHIIGTALIGFSAFVILDTIQFVFWLRFLKRNKR